MGKQVYLSTKQLMRVEMLLIDLKERADLTEAEEKDIQEIIDKLNK